MPTVTGGVAGTSAVMESELKCPSSGCGAAVPSFPRVDHDGAAGGVAAVAFDRSGADGDVAEIDLVGTRRATISGQDDNRAAECRGVIENELACRAVEGDRDRTAVRPFQRCAGRDRGRGADHAVAIQIP